MSTISHTGFPEGSRRWSLSSTTPAYDAYEILRIGFAVLPIVAGLDKFVGLLVNWDQYLAPMIASMLGSNSHTFMLVVGGVEIVAGIGVALRPRIFAYVVAAWLLAIIINLLIAAEFYDIALRDAGLCLAALALGRLSKEYDH